MRPFTASALIHVAAAALLLSLRFSTPPPPPLDRRPMQVTFVAPMRSRRSPPAAYITPPPQPRRFGLPHPAEAIPITAPLVPAPVLETPRLAPEPAITPQLTAAPAPPPQIKTGIFAAAPEPPPRAALPIPVKSAGFGAIAGAQTESHRTLAAASGFDTAILPGTAPGPHRLTQSSGFGDASVAAPRPSAQRASTASTTPVEILDKPTPAYTEDARQSAIEGEVLLQVLFQASGHAQVLGVVRGLGHGLDESAIAAVQSIRFRPARRDGSPVDSTAQVHIVFQLAY